ncbi:bifunctional phosphoribosyl-AMP cyclohydrolase/phosphoribosyl-ATP diphosphatase HisIE [Heliorestis acidaminivorans]|uniref:Histidine biosynthesis bifunctional protein HisIE n=1 Tax=Heliorestis acidaminivorans TaxID=553427 RepID=A0A6I0F0Q8_9FIRM|nr:bifunctional phosphoribosyl-AMP cyclohydrolase/phosphoribosyl-ATP diphosphatase HisIE [Heliorestis acidaminivorans]KAB2952664.1 bifunctional phosphoribosyl-AMP cyclohydrolase/phosphoribosyl-ATP diphosphatase HisIE [Heliorestis acidaminivorans]
MAPLKIAKEKLEKVKYDPQGLVTAIIQDYQDGRVLMVAYMNQESLEKTIETGQTYFYSRSRQSLWHKGETSGHIQIVKSMEIDCDGDALLFQVEQVGVACHEGIRSCFRPVDSSQPMSTEVTEQATQDQKAELGEVLAGLSQVIAQRKEEMPEGSYTTYLFTKGQDKILKKIGEEAAEVIIASKNNEAEELIYESCDLLYHLLVLLRHQNIELSDLAQELNKRR